MANSDTPKPSVELGPGRIVSLGNGPLLVILPLAILWKTLLLVLDLFPFNADEAIVGLMAKHILDGRVPTFFYGQAYMGSLDAILVAGFMSVLGEQVWVIRLVQVLLFAGFIYLTYVLSSRAFLSREAAIVTACLLAIPTVNMTLYSTVSLGGYNEALLLGALILLQLQRIKMKGLTRFRASVLGLLAGFGLWVFGLTLVFSVPALLAVFLVIHRQAEEQKKYYVSLLIGLALGASPWIIGALQLGPQALLQELFGSAIAGLSGEGFVSSILAHFRNFLLFGPTVILGLRPPWSTQALLPIMATIPILFWSGVAVISYRRSQQHGLAYSEKILVGSAGFLLAGFVLTPFGGDPSGRYFLPLTLTMAVLAGGAFDWLMSNGRKRLGIIFVTLVLLYHAGSTIQAALRDSDGLTTQFDPIAQLDFSNFPALISLLEAKDIHYGYTNYWVAYPLAFKSNEEIIFTPRLPYHQDFRYTTRDNRYPPYSERVEASDRVAYITTNHEALNRVLMKSFADLGVQYQWTYIEPFMVFHDLSASVRPDQINWPEGTMGYP